MISVYGLKNCDTCRKALKWLDAEGVEHRFHDVRADGVSEPEISAWAEQAGWETLLNRRGTTWRGLPESDRDGVDEPKAVALMTAHPALIKRPVFDIEGKIMVGFGDLSRDALKNAG